MADRLDRFRTLVAECAARNPFYRQRFAGRTPTRPEQLPLLTKADLVHDQMHFPPYGTNRSRPLTQYTRLHQSSGTSNGKPLVWLDTPETWSHLLDCWDRCYTLMGLTASDRLFFPFSFGPFLGFWSAFEAAVRRGCLCLPGGGMTSTARLHFLCTHRPTVLCGTPTYLLHLVETAASEKITLAEGGVRAIFAAGEPGASIPAVRHRIEAGFGARLFDHYGMTELGPVAMEEPDHPHTMTLLENDYLIEVIDPLTTLPVDAGTPGELVLTTLGRVDCPLLRYRTGDLVNLRRGDDGILRLADGILGRTDDMIHLRGNNVYPAAIEAVVRRFPEVAEFRIIVDRSGPLADLRLEIEPIPDADGPALAERIAQAVGDALLFRAETVLVPAGSLPRFEMKARRLVRAGRP